MRELGESGMSIGTSLCFETGEAKHAIGESDEILINLRTIIRNVIQAYPKDDELKNDIEANAKAVVSDITLIAKTIMGINQAKAKKITVYCPSYSDLSSLFPRADLWEPTTQGQLDYDKQLKALINAVDKLIPNVIKHTRSRLPEFNGRGTIITHHPVDLTLTEGVTRLSLLESYTGVVKPYVMWNTKLTDGNNLWNVPLNTFTIQVFGDRSVNFKSSSKATKTLVKDLAEKSKWTTATTKGRVRASILNNTSGTEQKDLLILL